MLDLKEMRRRVRADQALLLAAGLVVLGLSVVPYLLEARPEWRRLQAEFRQVVEDKFGPERAGEIPAGLQQIWIKELDRTDRCITCHQGVEWQGLEGAEEPFRTHPRKVLEKHPPSRYGCTICHGGQGWATRSDEAHGYVAHWDEPLLSSAAAEDHLVKRRSALVEMRCNVCHRRDASTQGMDAINLAKKLVKEKGCRACHLLEGRGGVLGPDLTRVGEKPSEQYDYSRLGGVPSVFEWHVAHFKQPKQMSPDTIMPDFHLGTEEAQALTLLVMSWRKEELPLAYLPGVGRPESLTPEELALEKAMTGGPGAFFVKNRCFVCHSLQAFGIPQTTGIGPDLSNAWEDCQKRFGRTLEDFLMKPSGTMEVVLSRQIVLTEAQKKEAISLLKQAYQQGLKEGALK